MRSTLEDDVCSLLEQGYLKEGFIFHDIIKEYNIPGTDKKDRIDYKGKDINNRDVFIEIKKWEITINDVLQILRYYLHAKPNRFFCNPRFIIIGTTISKFKKELLEKIGIEVQFLDSITGSFHD